MRQGSCRTVEQPPLTYRVVEKRVSETARPFCYVWVAHERGNGALVSVRTDERRASCGARSNVRPCSEPDDPNDHAQVIFFGPAYDTRQSTSFTFSQKVYPLSLFAIVTDVLSLRCIRTPRFSCLLTQRTLT